MRKYQYRSSCLLLLITKWKKSWRNIYFTYLFDHFPLDTRPLTSSFLSFLTGQELSVSLDTLLKITKITNYCELFKCLSCQYRYYFLLFCQLYRLLRWPNNKRNYFVCIMYGVQADAVKYDVTWNSAEWLRRRCYINEMSGVDFTAVK